MLLQIAFDINTEDEILDIVPKIKKSVSIIEIGTVALLRYGSGLITKVREKSPDSVILADAKIADGGRIESAMMFDAGADIVTVLGAMNEETIRLVSECAKERNKKIMVDLIGITDYGMAAQKLNPLRPDYVCAHVAVDIVSHSQLKNSFSALKRAGIDAELALAGGVTLDNLDEIIALNPDVIIVGRGITASNDIAGAAKLFWERINAC